MSCIFAEKNYVFCRKYFFRKTIFSLSTPHFVSKYSIILFYVTCARHVSENEEECSHYRCRYSNERFCYVQSNIIFATEAWHQCQFSDKYKNVCKIYLVRWLSTWATADYHWTSSSVIWCEKWRSSNYLNLFQTLKAHSKQRINEMIKLRIYALESIVLCTSSIHQNG